MMAPAIPVMATATVVSEARPPFRAATSMAIGIVADLGASESCVCSEAPMARKLMIALWRSLAIGIVLGGTQALARSYFSLLIPRGFEAEYFSFYHAMERGTSWFGTLVFGLVYQLTDSYRPAIFALIIFFVIGGALLLKVDTARGIREAGNRPPSVV